MIKNLLIIIIIISLLVLGFFLYTKFLVTEETSDLTIEPRDDLAGRDIIEQLNKLPNKIDGSLFQNPSYISLKDGGVQLQEIPAGKKNPFSPIFAPARGSSNQSSLNF